MSDFNGSSEDFKRALEALRSGVPNRDAVRALGCSQTGVVERFQRQLASVDEMATSDRQSGGMLIEGGFGAGKSHVLEYLKHLALDQNFVCSLIVVGKESPLYDTGKIFTAAAEAAVAPRITGNAIQEIALQMDLESARYAEFFRWANNPDSDINPFFGATLLLHERLRNDPEMDEKVRGFWAGEKLAIADVRQGMRQIGQWAAYPIRNVPAREMPHQRFSFVTRLIRAAGFRGWVLLFDEVELIGKYSRLQRARSYSELARWMGKVEAEQYPGLTAVASITDDYESAVLDDKHDLDHIGPLLLSKDTDAYRTIAGRAETGMRVIQRDAVLLEPPDDATLQQTHDTLKRIYFGAYDWAPDDLLVARTSLGRRMRSYVRRWINQWDLKRLYPGEALDTVETELRIDYSERPELHAVSESSDDQANPDLS
ncbi:hypothetical protein BH23CHL4_BH23CHL4_21840 [soil metagenome]